MGIKLAAFVMTTGLGTSVAGALLVVQEVVSPSVLSDETWVPLGIALTVLVASVSAGIKIALWISKTNREIADLKKLLSHKPDDCDD